MSLKPLTILIICLIVTTKVKTVTRGVQCGLFENTWNKFVNGFLSLTQLRSRKTSGTFMCKSYTNFGDYENKNFIYGEKFKAKIIYTEDDLKSLMSDFCEKYDSVEEFLLTDTTIETLDENLLKNCIGLKFLRANSNQFKKLPRNLLIENMRLEIIWLNENYLSTLPENIFINQKELRILWLNDNEIDTLSTEIFVSLEKLKELKLNDNKFFEIIPFLFENLHNLEYLDLDAFSSEKRSLKAARTSDYPGAGFNDIRPMQQLVTAEFRSVISELPRGAFKQLKNLKMLNLNNNNLSIIHSDSFGIHKRLTNLYLENNEISSIDQEFFDNTALSTLDIRNNICANFYSANKSEIKSNLTECFENYRPRPKSDCGIPVGGYGNIIGGKFISRGSFPWIAALVRNDGEYFCGGTLISDRKIISAAHCIQDKYEKQALSSSEFRVLLGVHNLSDRYELGRISVAIQKIYIHPEWNPLIKSFDADLVVLVTEDKINFNHLIQPICTFQSGAGGLVNRTGVTVGYGKSENDKKEHEETPKIIEIPIHDSLKCFYRFEDLLQLSSNRTFCGGPANGTGVCLGDSGNGMVIKYHGIYYLRGIVSSSLQSARYGCDVYQYSVFTDVLKFTKWIKGINDETMDLMN